jgi:hypothetical protein
MGRYARRDKLEYFWDRCALTPWDHAEERLSWMMSWVVKKDSDRETWLKLFSEAYSRLRGFVTEIALKEKSFTIQESKSPHAWTVSDNRATGTIDYSDFSVVKEFALY